MPNDTRVINNVYVYNGNMAIVFDQHGHQMDAYHGRMYDMKHRIVMDAPDTARFFSPVWTDSECRTEITKQEFLSYD